LLLTLCKLCNVATERQNPALAAAWKVLFTPPRPAVFFQSPLYAMSRRQTAYATLLTGDAYAPGVLALHRSLRRVGAAHPLVCLCVDGPALSAAAVDGLRAEGVRVVGAARDALRVTNPRLTGPYKRASFADAWYKLLLWSWTEFARVVYLDADAIVLKNVDALFSDGGGDGENDDVLSGGALLAAVQDCACVDEAAEAEAASGAGAGAGAGQRGPCAYAAAGDASAASAASAAATPYFNAGVFVLRPDRAVFDAMVRLLNDPTGGGLPQAAFPEQDFLNAVAARGDLGGWRRLPYTYNATKVLSVLHPALFDLKDVCVLHFVMDKPWRAAGGSEAAAVADPVYGPLHALWWDAYKNVPSQTEEG
jgi:hypothetical protein